MKKPFRVWNSKQLSDAFVIAAQIQAQIEHLYMNTDAASLKDIPHSMIPTESLYEIVHGYHLLFDAVLEHDLLHTGNKKSDHNLH